MNFGDLLNNASTFLFGNGYTELRKGQAPQYIQTDPNIIQRIQGGLNGLLGGPAVNTQAAPPPSPSPAGFSGIVQNIQSPSPIASPVPTPASLYGRNTEAYRVPNTPAPIVADAINKAAQTYGGDNPDLLRSVLYDVGLQESHFHPNLVNNTPAGVQAGYPTGLFQFTNGTWNDILSQYNNQPGMTLNLPTTDRTDPLTNAMAAAYLISKGQLGKWNASQGSWGPFYTKDEVTPFYNQSQDALNWSGLVPWKQ